MFHHRRRCGHHHRCRQHHCRHNHHHRIGLFQNIFTRYLIGVFFVFLGYSPKETSKEEEI